MTHNRASWTVLEVIRSRLLVASTGRDPDFVIGSPDRPYLLRWWLIPRNGVANAYLHCIRRSDDDRALHDHPYWNVSIILKGSYVEHTIEAGGTHRRVRKTPGSVTFRRATAAHRLELEVDECWTLFLTGPRLRNWGFHCPARWVRWQDFVEPGAPGAIGRGCGEQL